MRTPTATPKPTYVVHNEELKDGQDGYKVHNEEMDETISALETRKDIKEWEDEIDYFEKDAIKEYVNSGYEDVNKYLRGQKTSFEENEDLPAWMRDTSFEEKKAGRISDAIQKFKLDEPTVFHRGSSEDLLGGARTVEDIRKLIGKVVTDKAFLSTGTNATSANYGSINYHIQTPAGKGIGAFVMNMSRYLYETEFLFDKGSSFQIIGAYADKDGHTHVNLKYVGKTK